MSSNKIIFFALALCLLARPAQALFGLEARKERGAAMAQALAAYDAGDYAQTIDVMENFLLKSPPRESLRNAYSLMGKAYKMQGAYDKALLKYTEAVEFFPKDIEFNLALADIYYMGGLSQQAVEVYKKVLLLEPADTHAKLALARAYLDDGSFSRASRYFKEYIDAVDTRDPKVFYDYALSYFMATDYERAFELALKSAGLGETADTALLTAKIHKARGQKEEAFKKISEAARLWPEREDIYLTRALWLAFDKDYNKESLEMAEAYLKKHPRNRAALFIKYIALRRLGRAEEARQILRTAASSDSDGFIESLARRILDGKKGAPKSSEIFTFD